MNNIQKMARHVAGQKRQSGQAIVLIAMLMVILLASLGLAIDGGGMFLLWRSAQNAADAAAIQAAYAYCSSGDKLSSAVTAGYEAADDNGFNDNQSDNWVTVERANTNHPEYVPSNAPNPNSVIFVEIIAKKPAYFIQLVYGGPLSVKARAIGACTAGGSIYDGYSIFTMGTDAECGGTLTDGDPYDSNTGSAPLDLSGSDTNWYSPLYSNGSASITGSGSDAVGDDSGLEFVGGINGSAGIEDGSGGDFDLSSSDTDTPINSFPNLYNLNDYAPASFNGGTAGVHWLEAKASEAVHGTTLAWYYSGGGNHSENGSGNNPYIVQGLYFVDGNMTFGQNTTVGALGVTVVATGTITVNTDAGQVWRPFNASWPLFYSTFDYQIDGNGNCGAVTNAAVKISGNKILAFGNIYVPRAGIDWSGSKVVYCGSMISYNYSSSASGMHFFADSLPDLATLQSYGIVSTFSEIDWSSYAGLSCDYIESAPASFFIGDA